MSDSDDWSGLEPQVVGPLRRRRRNYLILFFVGLALLVGATVRLSLGRDDALGICLAWTFAVTGILFLVQFLAAARLAFDRSRVQLALDLLLTLLFFLVVV